jgi:hypothetical protein
MAKTIDNLLEVLDNISAVKGEEQAALASYIAGIAGAMTATTRRALEYCKEHGLEESFKNCVTLHNNSVQATIAILSILEKHYPGISADCKTMHQGLTT